MKTEVERELLKGALQPKKVRGVKTSEVQKGGSNRRWGGRWVDGLQ
jgi:hypothetical protein